MMNSVYHKLNAKFEGTQTYTGAHVMGSMMATIKVSTSLSLSHSYFIYVLLTSVRAILSRIVSSMVLPKATVNNTFITCH